MFIENMMTTAEQVVILYIVVAVGFLAVKTDLFTQKTAKACTNLLFFIITPAVIINSFLNIDYSPDMTKKLFTAIGCGLLMHFLFSVLSLPLFRKGDKNRNSIFKYACIHGNCGYMALPLANAVLGSEGVIFCSAIIISFQICAYTYGIYLMSSDKNSAEKSYKFGIKNIFLNTGVISVAIGMPLYLLQLPIPDIAKIPVEYIASMNTPLAMLIFGTYIAGTDFRSILREKKILTVGVFKLIIFPLMMLGIYSLLGIRGTLLASLILSASAPPANNTVIFAAKYDKDTGLAAQTVTAVSLVSILTMPAIIALSMSLM